MALLTDLAGAHPVGDGDIASVVPQGRRAQGALLQGPRSARAAAYRFRAHYHAALLPHGYDGRRHVAIVVALGIAAELALVLGVPQAFAWSYAWVVPATLVVASFVEYWAHRGPMHHRMPLVAAVFDRHTRRHHRYFTVGASRFDSHRDGHAVFFPAVLLVFFGAICAALGLVVATLLSKEIAAVFVATSIAYYLTYEALHFAYHCPARWKLGRLPLVRVLAHHHRTHHARSNMNKRNFNLVLPLFDWVFGTLAWGPAARRRTKNGTGVINKARILPGQAQSSTS